MTSIRSILVPFLAALLTIPAGTVMADTRGATPGYAADSQGNIVRSGSGDCVHTGSWSKSKAMIAGCDAYNQDLSEQRAGAVRNYLVGGGADPGKIVTWGVGEKEPIASNATPEGRAENRRVELLVLGRIKR